MGDKNFKSLCKNADAVYTEEEQVTFETMMLSLNAILPADKQIPSEKITQTKEAIKKWTYSEEFREKEIPKYYLIYEKATDQELVKYTKFIASKHGKWVNSRIETVIINGFQKCTHKFIEDLVEWAKKHTAEDQKLNIGVKEI